MTFLTHDKRQLDFLWIHTSLHVNSAPHILSPGIDITESREASENLRRLGQHDRMTGLHNRNTFTEDANIYIGKHK
jgi:hypothetical protein